MIIIVVESAGSIAELGAFSLHPKLRSKLLPILDQKYQKDKSFINTGPVALTNTESLFGPCIYGSFTVPLLMSDDLSNRVGRINSSSRKDRDQYLRRAALFLVCDTTYITGPLPFDDLYALLKNTPTMSKYSENDLHQLLGLGISMGLLSKMTHSKIEYYFWSGKEYPPSHFQHHGYMNIEQERAKFVSVLLQFPEYVEIFEKQHEAIAA